MLHQPSELDLAYRGIGIVVLWASVVLGVGASVNVLARWTRRHLGRRTRGGWFA